MQKTTTFDTHSVDVMRLLSAAGVLSLIILVATNVAAQDVADEPVVEAGTQAVEASEVEVDAAQDVADEPVVEAGAQDVEASEVEADAAQDAADKPVVEAGAQDADSGNHDAVMFEIDTDLFDDGLLLDPVVLTPESGEAPRLSGPANVLSEDELEQFNYSDPHEIVTRVPGVYTRSEDGFGLRPNIGLRGVDPDRSKKVTLMEDGILFGPAPYSAPAAYFFPMVQRMTGLEVYKGPATVRFGPQTISGAINFLSRPIPEELDAGVEVSLGSYLTGMEHGYVGASNEWGGILIEAVNSHSDGFKELDTGGPTGFSRSEFNLRGGLHFESDDARFVHDVDLGATYSREISHETYLGLSTEDFRDDPYRRYVGSDRGRMEWWRTGAHVAYRLKVDDEWRLNVALYRNDLDRSWRKFNRFADGTGGFGILANPTGGGNDFYYDALTGTEDSTGGNDLLIGTNARRYVSQGIQAVASNLREWSNLTNRAEFGVRLHNDSIERDHTEQRYGVRSSELELVSEQTVQTTDNTGETLAIAFHVHDRLEWRRLEVAGGVRVEHIMMDLETRPDDAGTTTTSHAETTQTAVLPGLGLSYEVVEGMKVLGGVHRGFSAVTPGQLDSIKPEYSVNYELGVRYEREVTGTKLEAVGFYNDYSNIADTCEANCGLGVDDATQFNGNQANVFGLELDATHTVLANNGYDFPFRLSYTYTHAAFSTTFDSSNPRWGDVTKGDAVPYVPRHELSLEAGVSSDRWSANLRAAFHDSVLEEAGRYSDDDVLRSDSYVMLDALASVRLVQNLHAFVRGENLLNQQAIAARRPYGARPVKPLILMGGFKWNLR